MSKRFSRLLKIALYTLGCFATTNICIAEAKPRSGENSPVLLAQVTPDGTLDTQVDRNGNVSEITGGATRGNNLFHSFQEFSILTGDTASFNNAEAIENIFSRVTGGNISNIDGLIRANGSANLFLINPAGIVFGENARLDLGGSFYGSTADSILFEDGVFSASDLENPPLLTINAPIGLNFRDNPGGIVNRANAGLTEQAFAQTRDEQPETVNRVTNITGLAVDPGQNLALIGGNITLSRGGITASGGNVTLGGLSQAGTVAIAPDGIFGFPEDAAKADLSLNNSARVNVVGDRGAINVDVSNLILSEQSQLVAGIAEGTGNSNTVAGDITINASDSVTLIGSGQFEEPTIDLDTSIINTVGLPPTRVGNFDNENVGNTAGSGGSIAIATQTLNINQRGVISTRLYGVGNAGDININADTVILNAGTLASQVGLSDEDSRGGKGQGNSGDLNLNVNNFTANNRSFVITDHKGIGSGDVGDINLSATESVVIQDDIYTAFVSGIGQDAVGNTGNINIVANSLNLENNVQLLTQLEGRGNAGSINLDIADSLVISDADLQAQILSTGEGQGGNVTVNAKTFELIENAQILASNENIGDSGDVIIQVNDSISVSNGRVVSRVGQNGSNTGDIRFTANSLNLENDAQLTTQAGGRGNAGSIDLNIADSLVISGGADIIAEAIEEGVGGDITINANTFELSTNNSESSEPSNLSQVLAQNRGQGNSGDIIIQTNESISLDNSNILSQIEQNGVGNAGDIKITANSLDLENNAQILTQVRGRGNAGSIDLDITDSLVLSSGADIQAQVLKGGEGTAGDIEINTNTLEVLERTFILADSRSLGNSGKIRIRADESVLVNFGIISTGTIQEAEGSSGEIEIISPRVSLTNRGIISSSTQGRGDTGDININAEQISLDNFSLITASSRSDLSGQPGKVRITNADRVTLTRGSIINATTSGSFDGSQINIDAGDLELLSGGVLQTATIGDGNAGDIILNIDGGIFLDGNNAPERPERFNYDEPILDGLEGKTGIFANVGNDTSSRGGNINIDSDYIVAYPNGNSDIIANARQGRGGNITIAAELLGIDEGSSSSPTNDNDIDASSQVRGLEGNIVIRSLDSDLVEKPSELRNNFVTAEQTTARVCQVTREAAAQNSFTIEGRGGIRPTPDQPLDSRIILGGNTSQSPEPQPVETSKGKIQLARGIKVTESGITLTAYRTNNAGERIVEPHNCS